ncbi:pesticidal crystal protein cry3ba [Fusarium flagelliforme]|uniref:Pesticidal crystal protein cry3ba n=1 Tax=Fusarium flagelliforme TaxID=2675880 RepID=A0A395MTN1_9HYPO|nr:pesticidal crystal protein cry3ba [Fusarium flagelliforme]
MGVKISKKFVGDVTTKLLKASDGGGKLDVSDPDAVGQYVCSVLALCCELIPGVGSTLSAFTTLLGGLLFKSNSVEKIWVKLRERIEELIDSKIEQARIDILDQKVRGLQDNMENYQRVLQDFEDSSGDEKERSRETLKATHIAFLSVVRAAVPEFQVKRFAVPSLPLFALAANIHLLLLSDGIKRGKAWGYSEKNINTMRTEFKKKTKPQDIMDSANDIVAEQRSMLQAAIAIAIDLEMPSKLIETWKSAHADLVASDSVTVASEDNYNDIDYIAYANDIYLQGRQQVKPYSPELDLPEDSNRGAKSAAKLRAYADYDSSMVMNVLSYTSFWPYLDGSEMPEVALKGADREIFFGPYGRYTDYAKWSDTRTAPITDRGPPITSAYLRGSGNVDGLQMKYGNSWGQAFGSTQAGLPNQLDLGKDEYFYWVSVWYGHKLGKVRFWNNKDVSIENGNCANGPHGNHAAPPGYALSSVHITNWESFTPRGCEGIILGFRPICFEFTPN